MTGDVCVAVMGVGRGCDGCCLCVCGCDRCWALAADG